MKTKDEINADITAMEQKLDETLEGVDWNAGPVRDTMKLVIPMMKDLTGLMREVLGHDSHTHFVDPRGATDTGLPEER